MRAVFVRESVPTLIGLTSRASYDAQATLRKQSQHEVRQGRLVTTNIARSSLATSQRIGHSPNTLSEAPIDRDLGQSRVKSLSDAKYTSTVLC